MFKGMPFTKLTQQISTSLFNKSFQSFANNSYSQQQIKAIRDKVKSGLIKQNLHTQAKETARITDKFLNFSSIFNGTINAIKTGGKISLGLGFVAGVGKGIENEKKTALENEEFRTNIDSKNISEEVIETLKKTEEHFEKTVDNFKSNHAKIYPLVRDLIDVKSNNTKDKDAIAVINIHQLGPIIGIAQTIGTIINNSDASDETKKLAIDMFASSITLTQMGIGSLPKEVASLAHHAGEEAGKVSPRLLKTIVESLQTSLSDHRNQHSIDLGNKGILLSSISPNKTPTTSVSPQKGFKI